MRPRKQDGGSGSLTEQEGMVLALIARLEEPTAHEIFSILDGSPTRTLRTSKGTIYPIVARLKARGYLEGRAVPEDKRRSELLTVTPSGIAAVRAWLLDLGPEQVLPYDPLRARIESMQFLSHTQRLEWISRVRQLNEDMRETIESYRDEVDISYAQVTHANASEALNAQLRWLNGLHIEVLQGEEPADATGRGQ